MHSSPRMFTPAMPNSSRFTRAHRKHASPQCVKRTTNPPQRNINSRRAKTKRLFRRTSATEAKQNPKQIQNNARMHLWKHHIQHVWSCWPGLMADGCCGGSCIFNCSLISINWGQLHHLNSPKTDEWTGWLHSSHTDRAAALTKTQKLLCRSNLYLDGWMHATMRCSFSAIELN